MDKFKPNSHAYRKEQNKSLSTKKVEKVITGTAKFKKKSEFSRFLSLFVPEDTDVKGYILGDIIIPMIKDAFMDTLNAIVYSERSGGRGRRSNSSNNSKISYRSYYEREDDRDRRKGSRVSNIRDGYSYEEVILDSRAEAENVILRLDEIIYDYQIVSIADLYDIVGRTSFPYTYNNYGWTDVQSAKVVHTRDGFLLKLPKPIPLK